MNSIRVSELAKELGLTSKEVIEKFAEIDIIVKSHSNTVSQTQIRKLKEYLGVLPQKSSAKPKAFVVKKAKVAQVEENKSEETIKSISKIEKVAKVPKIERVERIERVEKTAEESVLLCRILLVVQRTVIYSRVGDLYVYRAQCVCAGRNRRYCLVAL